MPCFESKPCPKLGKRGWEVTLVGAHAQRYCTFAVPEDSVLAWTCAWRRLAPNVEDAEENANLQAVAQCTLCGDFDSESRYQTALRVIYGLAEYLWEAGGRSPAWAREARRLAESLDGYFLFDARGQIRLSCFDGHTGKLLTLTLAPSLPIHGSEPDDLLRSELWQAILNNDLREAGNTGGFVQKAVAYYEFLCRSVRMNTDRFTRRSFVAFSLALAALIGSDSRYADYHRRELKYVYEMIARLSDDLDVARRAVRHLLDDRSDPVKDWRLLSLIQTLRRDEDHLC